MFAVIYLPDFALQVTLRHEPDLRGQAVAIVDEAKPAAVIQRSALAANAGVILGMTGSQALGRCPGLIFRTPGQSQLAAAQEILLQTGCAHSPYVESTAQGVCTFDLRGDIRERYRELAETIIGALEGFHLSSQVGVAGNPDLALMAARQAQPFLQVENAAEFLGPLPLSVLSPPRNIEQILRRWGIKTLGALAALRPDELTERLGSEARVLWELASGKADRVLTLMRPENTFEEAIEFEYEIETMEPLLFVLRRFLDQISQRLQVFGLAAEMLDLKLTFANGRNYERRFHVPAPTRDVGVLFRMVHTHLETLSAESPIIGLRVEALACHPRDRQLGLFETSLRNPNQFYETLAQLTGLVGTERVGQPQVLNTYQPDRFKMKTPEFEGQSEGATGASPMGMPLQRCRPARPIRVAVRESLPVAVFSEPVSGAIAEVRGPWMLSGDWWNEGWATEEWDVQIDDKLCRISQRNEGWFLDGIYG